MSRFHKPTQTFVKERDIQEQNKIVSQDITKKLVNERKSVLTLQSELKAKNQTAERLIEQLNSQALRSEERSAVLRLKELELNKREKEIQDEKIRFDKYIKDEEKRINALLDTKLKDKSILEAAIDYLEVKIDEKSTELNNLITNHQVSVDSMSFDIQRLQQEEKNIRQKIEELNISLTSIVEMIEDAKEAYEDELAKYAEYSETAEGYANKLLERETNIKNKEAAIKIHTARLKELYKRNFNRDLKL